MTIAGPRVPLATPTARDREPELLALRKLAEELAHARKEKTTTGHLLAAIASGPGLASELLAERRLDVDVLLKAARVVTDDAHDAISRAVQRAREFAGRAGKQQAGGLHLLFALCQERTGAAYRALDQCGFDVGKLRLAAMQLATGLAAPRRHVAARPSEPLRDSGVLPSTRVAPTPPPPARSAPPPMARVAQLALPPPPQQVRTAPPPPVRAPVAAPKAPPAQRSAPPAPNVSLASPALPASPASPASARPTAVPPAKKRGAKGTPGKPAAAPAAAAVPAGGRFELDPKAFPTLTALGRNLTLAAARGELDPVCGRDEEIDRALDVLAKRHANNPCLVGAAGVGKTSVVRGLAHRIAEGREVASLDDRVVVEIEPAALLAGTGMRGQLVERIKDLAEELQRAAGRVVVFFDELHTLFADAAGDEGVAELKMALAKGGITCIGATTREDYRRTIESDPQLARRFTVVDIDEPSAEEAFLAIESIAPLFERHHRVAFAKEAIAAAVTWSVRFIPGRALPDKAVSVLDLAGARARRRALGEVGREEVAEVVSEVAGVPTERLLETDGERMLKIEELLGERIVGHRAALSRVAAVLRRNASGFRSRRPIGSFLLLGPTGVGKTETAKAIAECLFHSEAAMTRLDLSEFAEPHAISRLVGAPPGYVGHEAGGHLTEAVRRRPYQVVLLDEIEKAHRDVLEAFLQVFDEGRLTDGRGRTIDFTNTVLLLTSNIGADSVKTPSGQRRIGFGGGSAARAEHGAGELAAYEAALVGAARAALPPELYNRLDEVLAFAPLSRGDVAAVASRMLEKLAIELEATRGVRLDVSEAAIDALLDSGGFDPELGARPMRRAIARLVEAPIAEMILRGEVARGDVATIDVEDGRIVVDAVTPSRPPTRAV